MPQTLTKAVMLDETGQDISNKINAQTTGLGNKIDSQTTGIGNKLDSNGAAIVEQLEDNSDALVGILDDIKDAITTSSEFIPLMLKVTTPPTKTAYLTGDTLDLSGITVMLIASNGTQVDVTGACTFAPADGTTLTTANTEVAISYYYPKDSHTFTTSQRIAVRELSSISVSTAPTKTVYKVGESLDLTGITVLAVYEDGYVEAVTQDCVFNPANGTVLALGDSSVSISYTISGVTKTTSQAIAVKELSSIAITSFPTKSSYVVGDALDLTGIVVNATYSDASTENVTAGCTFSPANGTILDTSNTTITATYIESGMTKTATCSITVSYPIYGVEWDGTASSAWTRTDLAASFADPVPALNNGNGSSPFDNILPWSGMERVEDANAGTLVKIPKFYYKWTINDPVMKLQICSSPVDGFLVSPAHADRGDGEGERDYVYVGAYHCGTRNKSVTNSTPIRKGFGEGQADIHNLGSDIWQWDYAMLWTIRMLYLVEFADWNSQDKIGAGSVSSNFESSGACDSMLYHTGTTAQSRTDAGHTLYRYIEDLWGNIFDWVDGIYSKYSLYTYIYCIKNPADFNASGRNGTQICTDSDSGTIKSFECPSITGFEYALFPKQISYNSSGTEYVCDKYYRYKYPSSSYEVGIFRTGAPYTNGQSRDYGLFYLEEQRTDYYDESISGARLMKLPANS